MIDVNTAQRVELELAIYEENLEMELFGTDDADKLDLLTTEQIRESLIDWIIKGNEATC